MKRILSTIYVYIALSAEMHAKMLELTPKQINVLSLMTVREMAVKVSKFCTYDSEY